MNSITQGNILKALLKFFFPLLLGTFFQQLYNTIDAIVVGQFAGKEALASVGGSSAVFVNLIVGFFMGVTNGGSVVISQSYGAMDSDSLNKAVDTSIIMSIIGGIIMSAAGILFTPSILRITKCPEEILYPSKLYLDIFFTGLIPMFIYNMCAEIFLAAGDSKTPLAILVACCFSNIFLDLIFVAKLGYGIAGVALGTVICQIESAAISIYLLARRKGTFSFNLFKMRMDSAVLSRILKIGIPAGLQGSLYVISNLIIQTNINFFGTDTVAGWAVYGKIDVIFWMMIATFGMALTTFSGQNYGAREFSRIKKATWITLWLSLLSTAAIVIAFINWSDKIYRLFTSDDKVIEIGTEMAKYLAPFYFLYISIEILSGCVRGTGKSLAPTLITVFGVCALRLLWLFIAVPANRTVNAVLFSYPLTWAMTSAAFWIYYLSGKWLKKTEG